jgi:CubicO group peptidase (beta-lactamase class C family)
MPRKLRLAAGALALVLTLTWLVSPKARSVMNWTYVHRLATYPWSAPVTTVSFYNPLERVEGGDGQFLMRVSRTDPLGASTRAQLDEFAKASRSAALIVVRNVSRQKDPEVLYEYYDYPDADPKPGRTRLSDSNSMAKTPLGLLIGIALSQGKIASLDEPVSSYITEWQGDERRSIRIRHLLRMTSGLRNQNSKTFPLSDLAVMHLGTQLQPFALSIPAAEPPGTRYEYNNVNSEILAIILERVYGRRYTQILSEQLWKPLAAKDAFIWLDHDGGQARTYCCLFANPIDWARLGLLFLDRGEVDGKQVVPASWIDEMLKPSSFNPSFGAHLWLGTPEKKFEAPGLYMISGLGEQHVFILPRQKIVIVRVGEKDKTWRWEENYLPNLVSRALPRS